MYFFPVLISERQNKVNNSDVRKIPFIVRQKASVSGEILEEFYEETLSKIKK